MTETAAPALLWTPTAERIQRSQLHRFMTWLRQERGRDFPDYDSLWRWSVSDLEGFWAAAWGAALCAGAGAGLFASPTEDPRDLASIETTYRPDPGRQKAYDEKYRIFLDLAGAMKPFWPALRRLGAET